MSKNKKNKSLTETQQIDSDDKTLEVLQTDEVVTISGTIHPLGKQIAAFPSMTGIELTYTVDVDCSKASREDLISMLTKSQSISVWLQNSVLRPRIAEHVNANKTKFNITLHDYLKAARSVKTPRDKALREATKMDDNELNNTIKDLMRIQQERGLI